MDCFGIETFVVPWDFSTKGHARLSSVLRLSPLDIETLLGELECDFSANHSATFPCTPS